MDERHWSLISGLSAAALFLLGLVALPQAALSATFSEGIVGCDHTLVGEIVAGDMSRIVQRNIMAGETLCLHSPGGDLEEGIAIAQWLEGRNIKTILPPRSECYSSCAIIFMAGSEFEETYMHRRAMHVTANLGFHAPYLNARGSFSAKELEQVYAIALENLAKVMSIGAIVERGDPGFIPPRVILELLKRGPSEMYMVDTVYRARELNIELIGAPLPDWSVQNLCNACTNMFDGHVRTEICSTAQETERTDEHVDILFFGVGGEGSYHCGVRLEKDSAGSVVAKIDPHPTWEDYPLDPAQLQMLTPEMALTALGH